MERDRLTANVDIPEEAFAKPRGLNPPATNWQFVRDLIAYAYEHGYHEHGYDVLAELLGQVRAGASRELGERRDAPMDDSDRLKPCPFCGAEAEIVAATEAGESAYVVSCTGCDACSRVYFALKDDVRPLLFEAWNRRAGPAPGNFAQAHGGLTKRELFAAMALQGMVGDPSRGGHLADYVRDAVKAADFLIEELTKKARKSRK